MPLPVSLWEGVKTQSHRGAGRAVNKAGIRGGGQGGQACPPPARAGRDIRRDSASRRTKTPNAWPSDSWLSNHETADLCCL